MSFQNDYLKEMMVKEEDLGVKGVMESFLNLNKPKSKEPKNNVEKVMSMANLPIDNDEQQEPLKDTPWYNKRWGRSLIGGGLSALASGVMGQGAGNSFAYGLKGAGATANTFDKNQRLDDEQKRRDEYNKILDEKLKLTEQTKLINAYNDKQKLDDERKASLFNKLSEGVKAGTISEEVANKYAKNQGLDFNGFQI